MAAYFPLFVNIEHKKFRVYGAGKIAARRVQGLLRHGADVTVIAPQILGGVRKLQEQYPGQLVIEQRAYRMGELQNAQADFVLAATNDTAVNTAICRESRQKKIPTNNASDKGQCDFYFPALVYKDGMVIGMASIDGNHAKTAKESAKLRQGNAELGEYL